MWYTSLPGITSRHWNEEALCHCSDSNTMITEHFYKKPIKSEVLTLQKSPLFKSHAQCQAERRHKTLYRSIHPPCVSLQCTPSGGNIFNRGRDYLIPFGEANAYHSAPCCRSIAHLFSLIQSPTPDLTFNRDVSAKYADLSNKYSVWEKKSSWKGPAEVDTMAQCDPLAPPALDSVYKVPTPLISAPITPQSYSSAADQTQPESEQWLKWH